MRIDSLQLFQFRNYKDVQIQFNPEIIVLYGTNGAGKTNILESIYVGPLVKAIGPTIHRICSCSMLRKQALSLSSRKRNTPQKGKILSYSAKVLRIFG